MNKLTPMERVATLLVALLLAVSLASLAVTYFIFLRVPLTFAVSVEDQWAVEQGRSIATRAFFIALTSGIFIGIIASVTTCGSETEGPDLPDVPVPNLAPHRMATPVRNLAIRASQRGRHR